MNCFGKLDDLNLGNQRTTSIRNQVILGTMFIHFKGLFHCA